MNPVDEMVAALENPNFAKSQSFSRAYMREAAALIRSLAAERDELRAKLFPYADATEISGMSWNGFYLIGDKKSIKELRRLEHRSAQLETFEKAYNERSATAEAENAVLRSALTSIKSTGLDRSEPMRNRIEDMVFSATIALQDARAAIGGEQV